MSDKPTLCTCPTEVHFQDCRVIDQWGEIEVLRAQVERLRALMHRLWHQRKDMEVASIEFPRVSRDDLLDVRDELAKPKCC